MDFRGFYAGLTPAVRMRLLIGAAVIVAATVVALWWLLTPRQQLLFGNLREAEAAEIVQALNEWKVPHTIVDGGTAIAVAEDAVYETRMRLVSAGIPRGGHVGFELFNDSDFGVTEFAQRVNFQRALQGELERTIAALPGVEGVRVHLTIRRPGLFVGERESSKASVVLSLRPGQTLTRQQLSGIRSLVAAAVEGLVPDAVAVLDAHGGLLAGATAESAGLSLDERTGEEVRLETTIRHRVTELLGQVLQTGEFRVSVDATLNFDKVHEVSERPLPYGENGNALIARKRVNSTNGGESGREQNNEEAEYVHGVAREEVSRAPGRIERLSVAVILPPRLDELEVARIQSLVAAAAGIEPERGDRLEVVRLGVGQTWETAVSSHAPSSAVPTHGSVGSSAAEETQAGVPSWAKWVLVGVLGVLVGTIGAMAVQSRPKALSAQEREAALQKLRSWLAEGSARS